MAKKRSGKLALGGQDSSGKKRKLSIPEKETVYQTYLALGNGSEVCRTLGISRTQLNTVIRWAEATKSPEVLQQSREQMANQQTTRYHGVVSEILESIKPEDLESGRIPEYNAKGEIVGYKYYGPSLLQKMTASGIATDKMRVLRDYQVALQKDGDTGRLIMPESVGQLVEAIKNRVESLQILNVNFREDNPDLSTRLNQVLEVQAVESPEAQVEEIDLRNP